MVQFRTDESETVENLLQVLLQKAVWLMLALTLAQRMLEVCKIVFVIFINLQIHSKFGQK